MPTRRRATLLLLLVAVLAPRAAVRAQAHDLGVVTDAADAALAILERRHADPGAVISPGAWARLQGTEGYRRLHAREAAMGRAFSDSAFRAFLLTDTMAARAPDLRRALTPWASFRADSLAAAAARYLPRGATIRARIYPLIKPRGNSFVFRPAGEVPAIMLFLDPGQSAAQAANTMVHELHHIGLGAACDARDGRPGAPRVAAARRWLSAFGEGLAMLAAAGGPDVHPHATSPAEDRARWDADIAQLPAQFAEVERFVDDLLAGRLEDEDAQRARGMALFGIQGPWYTAGWYMAATVERARGRAHLVGVACDPVALMRDYNDAAPAGAPRWPARLLDALREPG